MSLKWPNKDPDEIVDYSVDWSRFLKGASLSSVTWYVNDADGVKTELVPSGQIVHGIQLISATNTSSVATARFGSGTNNVQYKVYCQITDSNGLVVERTIRLRVRNK
jgi:hypothetical protein